MQLKASSHVVPIKFDLDTYVIFDLSLKMRIYKIGPLNPFTPYKNKYLWIQCAAYTYIPNSFT